ncbi:hypothetical protein F4802DRAFT_106416 [Xylaria palmicola]|nr:hypothetical protein F4802DRAFT_106416 [Xylaria palmicola]
MSSVPMDHTYVDVGHCSEPVQDPHSHLVQGRINLLLDLPPELRISIYDLVVGCTPTDPVPITEWRNPALAQVNRQLRGEVLQSYYGRKDGLHLLLSCDTRGPRDVVTPFCEQFSPYLQIVKRMNIHVRQSECIIGPFPGKVLRLDIDFAVNFSQKCLEGGKTGRRIGGDETNWDDDTAAAEAFEDLDELKNGFETKITPGPSFSSHLSKLAKHAKLASRWIELSYNRKDPELLALDENDPKNYFGAALHCICISDSAVWERVAL